jgi:hypothetical protein
MTEKPESARRPAPRTRHSWLRQFDWFTPEPGLWVGDANDRFLGSPGPGLGRSTRPDADYLGNPAFQRLFLSTPQTQAQAHAPGQRHRLALRLRRVGTGRTASSPPPTSNASQTATGRFVKLPDSGWVQLDTEAVDAAQETMADLGVDGLAPSPKRWTCSSRQLDEQPPSASPDAMRALRQRLAASTASKPTPSPPPSRPKCGPTRRPASISSATSPNSASAASWPTTWASAKPSRPSPGSPGSRNKPAANPSRRSSSAPRPCSTTGAARPTGSPRTCACSSSKAAPPATTSASKSPTRHHRHQLRPAPPRPRGTPEVRLPAPSSSTKPSSSRTPPPRSPSPSNNSKAEHRLALTGTPLENRMLDLWSIVDFIQPGYLGNQAHFAETYEPPARIAAQQRIARKRLSAKLRPLMLRRLKKQVAKDLPDRIEDPPRLRARRLQRKLYLAELRRSRDRSCRPSPKRASPEQDARPRRAHPPPPDLLPPHPRRQRRRLRQDRDAVRTARTPARRRARRSSSSASSSRCSKSSNASAASAASPPISSPAKPRTGRRSSAPSRDDPNASVFLLSLRAAGTGLNLTTASYVVLYDPWWNPAVEAQAIDRSHRIGQTRTVNAYRLIAPGTVEEKIWELQQARPRPSADVLGEEGFARSLS